MGYFYQEHIRSYILTKPKLLPFKSVTLQKLDSIQKTAQEDIKKNSNISPQYDRLVDWSVERNTRRFQRTRHSGQKLGGVQEEEEGSEKK